MSAVPGSPGFYGKLPAVGDFVHRRLPQAFVDPWHAAMQVLLHAVGAGAVTHPQQAPVWRFVLAPGLAGPTAWAGAMRASVDRVGRTFPLVIAAPLPTGADAGTTRPAIPACMRLPGWLDAADTVLRAVDGEPAQDAAWLDSACAALAQRDSAATSAALPIPDGTIANGSLWWTAMDGVVPGTCLHLAGWPTARHAPALLGASVVADASIAQAWP
ncbi:type VI secretion system-associated protein TagF [Xanthomonas axonopodis pv. poinsettiicola]|uniref:type VI secretion system-associated protein TagF n=1 Tax=Xanthomonas TaxID=338 RepID=UPI001E394A65|nr:type VI secretion system-associated protein TagF [Xanthomonas codiaei]MCC8536845.1 type VI secretion system-associated protein TagF [Xanthomonas codiaei]